ncbi:unnamed protein product [Amoebophrya sp. A120]|nr:unnamed protein product [Amoebophrya sp. A120]|eukprot:GSA120T00009223001.1
MVSTSTHREIVLEIFDVVFMAADPRSSHENHNHAPSILFSLTCIDAYKYYVCLFS